MDGRRRVQRGGRQFAFRGQFFLDFLKTLLHPLPRPQTAGLYCMETSETHNGRGGPKVSFWSDFLDRLPLTCVIFRVNYDHILAAILTFDHVFTNFTYVLSLQCRTGNCSIMFYFKLSVFIDE